MDHDYKAALEDFDRFDAHTFVARNMSAIRSALEIASKLQEGEYHLCRKVVNTRNISALNLLCDVERYEPITAAQETRKG